MVGRASGKPPVRAKELRDSRVGKAAQQRRYMVHIRRGMLRRIFRNTALVANGPSGRADEAVVAYGRALWELGR